MAVDQLHSKNYMREREIRLYVYEYIKNTPVVTISKSRITQKLNHLFTANWQVLAGLTKTCQTTLLG